MEYDAVLEKIGAVRVELLKCIAFCKGSIKELSIELKRSPGCFEVYANVCRLLNEPVFSNYRAFSEMLRYFARPNASVAEGRSATFSNRAMYEVAIKRRGSIFASTAPNSPVRIMVSTATCSSDG